MKRNIEIFGKKVPLIAILITLLVIGTASAKMYEHYATAEGRVMIESPITVTIDGTMIDIGENHEYPMGNMLSPGTINETLYFNNTYGSPIDVEIIWILYETGKSDLNASTSYWIWDNATVQIPEEQSSYEVNLTVPVYMMGDHTFAIAVNPVIT